MKLASSDNTVGILIGLALVVLLMPLYIIKFSYLDKRKELREVTSQLKQTRLNAASILKLMESPDAFDQFIQNVTKKRGEILRLRPKPAEMIETQKVIADLAKRYEISIVSFRPLEEDLPVELVRRHEKKDEAGKEQKQFAENLRMAKLDVLLSGRFENLCEYLRGVEDSERVTVGISHLKMSLRDPAASDVLEAEMQMLVIYSDEDMDQEEVSE